MTIAFDAATSLGGLSFGGPLTADFPNSHTPAGTPRGVVVFLVSDEDTDTVSAATYGGVAMTEMSASPKVQTLGTEHGVIHGFWLGSGVPTGVQVVGCTATAAGSVWGAVCTVTAATNTELSASAANEAASGTAAAVNLVLPNTGGTFSYGWTIVSEEWAIMAAGLREVGGSDVFVAGATWTGCDAVTNIAPNAGQTQVDENDFGTSTGGWSRVTALQSDPPTATPSSGGTRRKSGAASSFTIDGRPVPLIDWQCDATANWGDRTLTGKLPRWVTWAEQGSEVVAWRGPDDAMWSGEMTADPRDTGDWLAIRAHGHAQKIAADATRMFYRIDGGEQWAAAEGDPHNYTGVSDLIDADARPGRLIFTTTPDEAYALGEQNALALWVEGGLITRVSYTMRKNGNQSNMDIYTSRATGPSGSGTNVDTFSLAAGNPDGTSNAFDISDPEDLITIALRVNTAFTPTVKQKFWLTSLKVYGRTTDDAFSVSDVAADVGASAGLATDHVRSNALGALPLDWETRNHTELLDYMAELADWCWLVRHDGLHFGPYERTWNVFVPGDATGDIEPERRHNRVEQPFRALSGRLRVKAGVPTVDPYPGQTFTLRLEELADPQSDATLAQSVATTRAEYEASRRLTGSLDLVRVRADGEATSPYFVTPGDLIRIPNVAPGVAPQRVKGVTYRPGDKVSVDLGTGFNVVRTLSQAAKAVRKR